MLLKFRDRCSRPAIAPTVGAQRGAQSAYERRAPALVGLGRRGPHLVRDSAAAARLARRGHPEGRIAATVPLAHGGFDVAVGVGDCALITRSATATVERLHLRSLRFDQPIAVGSAPTCIAVTTGGIGYVSNQFSSSISIVEEMEGRVLGEIAVAGDPAPVAVDRDGRTLFVATNTDRLYAIRTESARVDLSLPLPATSHHLVLHPRRPLLYVATRDAGTVLEVDQAELKPLREFVVGGRTQGMVVAPDGAELYVANEQGGLDVIDLATGSLTASLELGGPAFAVAATPDRSQLYVGLVHAERVQVLDRQSLRVVGTIPTGGIPRGIAFDPRTQTALIANEAGWVTVVA
jgi:YVTN family beta-propeller protein